MFEQAMIQAFFEGLSKVGRIHPQASLRRHGVECIRDVPYRNTGLSAHKLDIYRPTAGSRPMRVLVYVHGGGFRILSKETHWIFGLMFARAGFLVFSLNYRLGSAHPFPAPLEDVLAAIGWVRSHARDFGGDGGRMVLAGDSAGANLVTAATCCLCFDRREPVADSLRDLDIELRAVLPACGILDVSDPEARFARRPMRPFYQNRLRAIAASYVPSGPSVFSELANPIKILEAKPPLTRPMPRFFATVGTSDPLLEDSERLSAALKQFGPEHEVRFYLGEPHAFQALLYRPQAKVCWQDTERFLGTLGRSAEA
jgi:acetyl esterase